MPIDLLDLQSWRDRVIWWRLRTRQPRTLTSAASPRPVRTAWVLLGGGARGAAQAGAISVLLQHGLVPDLIVGISAGAWNGAYMAQNPTPAQALALEGLWIATTSQEVLGARRWSAAVNAVAFRPSLYNGERLRRVAERYLKDKSWEDLRVPLRIVATDLVSGEPRIFSSGQLLPAVLASSAMPGVFPPVLADDAVLVDGGIVEWSGCLEALEAGASRICLVGCGSAFTRRSTRESYRNIFERSWEIGNRSSFSRTVFALRGAGVEVIPIHPRIEGASLLNFDRAPALVRAGRASAERAIEEWKREQQQVV